MHKTATALATENSGEYKIDLSDALAASETIDATAPIFIIPNPDSGLGGKILKAKTSEGIKENVITIDNTSNAIDKSTPVFVDFYVLTDGSNAKELQIDAENFAGNYYVEASTLFRDVDGKDLPAEITMPNVKIQSNFTFTMASSGDPSTFTFTMDAFPGYTMFDRTKKVICVMQIIEDSASTTRTTNTVMPEGDVPELKDADSVDNSITVTSTNSSTPIIGGE